MRVCETCGVSKPLTEFSFRKDNQKHRPDCKPCRSTATAAARYGMTVGDVQALVEKQDGRCAICGTHHTDIPHKSFAHNPLVIDHDHTTGATRGLLCPTCNCGLGLFKDDPALLQAAISYLS